MHRTILAAAGLLAAGAVVAEVRADPIYSAGTFTTPGQVDRYTVGLKRGGWYALSVPALGPGDSLLATITDPRGRVVGGKPVDSTQDGGFGFRAPVTGPYTLSLRETGGELIWNYGWYVGGDCPDKSATPCTLRLGRTQQRFLLWAGDADRERIQLTAGKHYTLTVDTELHPRVQVLDKAGKVLAQGDAAGATLALPFKAGGEPTYVRVVSQDKTAGAYRLTVTQP